ncbi:Serine/threonine protein kinase [Streptosporangium subroseum]|uniref:non-specific serine/threonine protein kinase n=1 Tax=Streptosporangium subroseum TaxID=106412 RepID=A0A239FZ83_9ACTN|nr:serine/threonine-protein kinase [Streptosporangium subroseum]SNS62055.1 Serine/threonine protein kinase [Streptosporangium subroseum]
MGGTEGWAVSVPGGYRVGDWQVGRPIATGSWASVYEGRREGEGETRSALKFLPTGTVTRRQLRHLQDMTQREIRLHRSLQHPRLVRLRETLVVDDAENPELDGACVLVMDLAERSLADLIGSGTPVPDAPRLIAEICEGLAHMHAAGWVHGDLKPNNVLMMADGSVRLADFGLATELDGTHGYLPPAGSVDHVPPERWGEPLSERGHAVWTSADIWALGVTACQLLTGHLPFSAPTARARYVAATEYAAGDRPLALPASLPEAWRSWVSDCLAPNPRSRPGAALQLYRARMLAGAVEVPLRRARRRTAGVTALALLMLAGVSGAGTVSPSVADPFGRWLRTGSDIPPQYRALIVEAGTMCSEPGLSPALIAGMLKTESDFDPNLSDVAKDEYGIARWTPSVLQFYLPPAIRGTILPPPLPPEVSIPAVGRYLCVRLPLLTGVPGDPGLLGAVAFRSSGEVVREAKGVPARFRAYAERVRKNRAAYEP